MPDGTLVDFGTAAWHSDGTELINSGSRNPVDGDFRQGVWAQVGPSIFTLNQLLVTEAPRIGIVQVILDRETVRRQSTIAVFSGANVCTTRGGTKRFAILDAHFCRVRGHRHALIRL